jgi:hypothetical protein
MKKFIRILICPSRLVRFTILAVILIYIIIFGKHNSFKIQNINLINIQNKDESILSRSVVVTLIRGENRSIFMVINMIHSIVKFHSVNNSHVYPFLIFHEQDLTSDMRQYILSCILRTNKEIQISFALVNFTTTVLPAPGTRMDKPVGYRLMCQFWTYDLFYHPAIQGRYDYLMRMDDDSYLSDVTKKDLFVFMENQKIDYMYRSLYYEPHDAMSSILQRFLGSPSLPRGCIYNNFFIIRLKWVYESQRVQSFLRELIHNDSMIRYYIGDGCAHGAMVAVDDKAKIEHITDISYGHNFHIMLAGQMGWMFLHVPAFRTEMHKSCQELILIKGANTLTKINIP